MMTGFATIEAEPENVQRSFRNSIDEVKTYDIEADRKHVVESLTNSQEIEDLTSTIDVGDLSTIVTFGRKAAENLSQVADTVLKGMTLTQSNDSTTALESLTKIMEALNTDESENKPSILDRLFGTVKKEPDRILEKYESIGEEVDRIYVRLKQFEGDIRENNRAIEKMFSANVAYFHELEKYIVAGEQGCREIDDYIKEREHDFTVSGDPSITFELHTLRQALDMLQRRTEDMRISEAVAMQSIPMLKMIEYANINLAAKIDAAFIVTLPVFKQELAEAIAKKRQRLQSEAISQLERRNSESVMRGRKTGGIYAKPAEKPVSGNVTEIDALKRSKETILNGIKEVNAITEQARNQELRATERLEAIKRDFAAKYSRQQ